MFPYEQFQRRRLHLCLVSKTLKIEGPNPTRSLNPCDHNGAMEDHYTPLGDEIIHAGEGGINGKIVAAAVAGYEREIGRGIFHPILAHYEVECCFTARYRRGVQVTTNDFFKWNTMHDDVL